MNDYTIKVERADGCDGFWLSLETESIYVDDSEILNLILNLQQQYREYIG